MEAYVRELLALRYDGRLMKQLSVLDDGLLRRAWSLVAYARYLCPHIPPAVSVTVHPASVVLSWHWKRCMLILIVPQQQNPFDDPEPDEEIEAFFLDRDSGEFWRATGFTRVGSGAMSPLFPPQVEQKLLEAHADSVVCEQPKRGKSFISAFRFKRLFPDLPVAIAQDDVPEQEATTVDAGLVQQTQSKSGFWSRLLRSFPPLLEAVGAGFGRYLVEEAVPNWLERRRLFRRGEASASLGRASRVR